MVTGFLLGKFFPYHLGHKYLIEESLKKCDFLYVLVCSLEREDAVVPGLLRHHAVDEDFKHLYKKIKVLYLDEEMPQYPNEHPNFYSVWREAIFKLVSEKIDIVFTSEDYGDEFADSLGAKHICIDKDRIAYPISGTLIREDLSKHFNLMAPSMKRVLAKRIAIVGSESVGKTTVVEKLTELFSATKVEEYGREYVDKHLSEYKLENLKDLDYIAIAKRTYSQIIDAVENPQSLVTIFDTEIIVTAAWSKFSLGDVDWHITEMIQDTVSSFDAYILLSSETPFVQDGTRMLNNDRDVHTLCLCGVLYQALDECGSLEADKFYWVGGEDYDDRQNKVEAIVRKVISQ
jgi:HTH-type transcriptional repressor of NAD biosynthesis genes